MAEFIKAAIKSDIPEGTGKTVEIAGKKIALFNAGGVLHAIDDTCRHRGGPLGEGSLEATTVTCPWHGWQYDVATGACSANPDIKVQTYPVKIEGEDVLVAV